ncbi:MAG: hypothetical protein LQ350_005195 [Teloschistes chrysophthalmus]|nr:MAG: hypothetical protein LQ350_005195 [Niorma chrysophthalma]
MPLIDRHRVQNIFPAMVRRTANAREAGADGSLVAEEDLPRVIENFVRICPHENLSFSRFQRIKNLAGFKDSFNGVNLLGEACGAHPTMTGLTLPDWNHQHGCVLKASDGEQYFGVSKSCLQRGIVSHVVYAPLDGAVLRTDWVFWLDLLPPESVSVQGVQQVFVRHPILCEHMDLLEWVTPKVLVQAAQCCRHSTDPVSMKALEQTFFRSERCGSCNTWFEQRVSIGRKSLRIISRRYLGKAKSAKGGNWLSQ